MGSLARFVGLMLCGVWVVATLGCARVGSSSPLGEQVDETAVAPGSSTDGMAPPASTEGDDGSGNGAAEPPADPTLDASAGPVAPPPGPDGPDPEADAGALPGPVTDGCGDGFCAPSESCSSCAQDCGVCPPNCGDGECDETETCTDCEADCGVCGEGYCGDTLCQATEDCASCGADCGPCASTVCGSCSLLTGSQTATCVGENLMVCHNQTCLLQTYCSLPRRCVVTGSSARCQ